MTDFLFAQPSFLTGVARTFDLFGLFDQYNESPSPEEADLRALRCDFIMVGQDLITAINAFAAGSAGTEPPPVQYSFVFAQDAEKTRLGA